PRLAGGPDRGARRVHASAAWRVVRHLRGGGALARGARPVGRAPGAAVRGALPAGLRAEVRAGAEVSAPALPPVAVDGSFAPVGARPAGRGTWSPGVPRPRWRLDVAGPSEVGPRLGPSGPFGVGPCRGATGPSGVGSCLDRAAGCPGRFDVRMRPVTSCTRRSIAANSISTL